MLAYRHAIAQAVAAEAAGFAYFWTTEQHFFMEIGHSPCPDMLLAAIAERTRTIRLGFAVMLMTVHNPFIIAEKVATLDVLSNGRVEFGMGRGSTQYMVEALGVDATAARAQAGEATEAVMRMFAEEHFAGFKGNTSTCRRATSCRARCSVRTRRCGSPRPIFETYEHAARQGVGVIGVTRN